MREECAVSVSGLLRPEPRAPGGAELAEARCTVLSWPAAPPPVPLSKKSSVSLDTELSLRPVTLRAPRARAVFRIQAAICRAFREFLQEEGFTEIHTPKLGRAGAEGGLQPVPGGLLRPEGGAGPVPPALQAGHGGGV